MRNLTSSFTMRKDGVLPRGDWFRIENKTDSQPAQVYIYDEIGFWGTEASDFVQQLVALDADKIDLHLNSPGGEIFDGLAIYNALKQNKAEVTVYVDGLAASAASFIAQAGDKVVMARNAQMMIHDGIAMAYGNEQDMLDTAELLSKLSNNIADIYAQASSRRGIETDMDGWRAFMREEVWYDGREAVEAGLADEVTDSDDEEAEKAKNKWDLSFYNHAGRERAESPTRVAARLALSNKEKESEMPKPKNQNEPDQPEVETPPADPADPETPPADPAPESDEPESDEPTGDPAPSQDPVVTPPQNIAPQNGVMINGKLETDWKVINQHFQALQTAQQEQQDAHRRSFVEKLAADNKIAATQIDQLVALVNGNGQNVPAMSEEQFAAFAASYESAPASTLFSPHATQTGQPGQSSSSDKEDRISVLEGIVAMHRRTMPEEAVQKTASYAELQKLLGNNNES